MLFYVKTISILRNEFRLSKTNVHLEKGMPKHLCPGSILLAKICQQIIFAIVATEIIAEKIMTNSFTNIAKIARVTNVTKIKA